MPKRLVLAGMLLIVACAGAGWWWWSNRPVPAALWQGYAEADYVKIGPTQPGLLTTLAVGRGAAVQQGALLFTQDDTDDRAARDQAAEQLAQAQDQLTNLENGGKPTEITQAEANLADAQATLVRTTADLSRAEAQVASGAISRQAADQARADHRSAQAKVNAMQAALTQALAPMGRVGEIAAQRAAVAAAKSALAMADWRLAQRRVTAPAAGRIADVRAQPGETMAAGAPVVSLLPPGNIFVRFFVPEPKLASIHLGNHVGLVCDGCPADLSGTISFIAPQAEYTPPLIYSEANSAKLVYTVEARPPPDRATTLNPGQPVQVRPP